MEVCQLQKEWLKPKGNLLNKIPDINYKDEIEAMNPIVLNNNLKNI